MIIRVLLMAALLVGLMFLAECETTRAVILLCALTFFGLEGIREEIRKTNA